MGANPVLRRDDGSGFANPDLSGEVRELQAMLCQAGYEVSVLGVFDEDTEWAVKRFQKESGLADDGVVGPDTWESLEMASAARPAGAKWPNLRAHDGYQNTTPQLNPSVKELQRLLNERGASLEVDGYFGPKTDEAVRAFQKRHEIHEYGVVGVRSWSALHFARMPLQTATAVDEARALDTASQTAEREGWEWGRDVAVLDKRDRWRVVSNGAGGTSVVVEVDKESGDVVFLERRVRRI
jgi:peptidoglycan hydrolase-like protein with peptidoglycan-binding domain